jgi:hypothetical protein
VRAEGLISKLTPPLPESERGKRVKNLPIAVDKNTLKEIVSMTTKPGNRQYSGVIQHQRVSDMKVGRSRDLRKKMTSAETVLWAILRGKKCCRIKFRRQQIVEP